MTTIIIHFANGSSDTVEAPSFSEAFAYCCERISYTGGKVRRVEIETERGSRRAVWDSSWDAVSKARGLRP